MRFKKERQISAYLPLWGHVTDHAILLDDGSVFGMFEVTGLPWETSGEVDVLRRHIRLNATYKNIANDTIILSVYQCRGMSDPSCYPVGIFRTAFSGELDSVYRNRLFDCALYDNRIYLGVQIRPPRYAGEFVGERVWQKTEELDEERLQKLEDVCAFLQSDLTAYSPRRLGLVWRGHSYFVEIAEALVFAMTGYHRQIPLTSGRLGESMFSEKIIVGREAIEYRLPGSSWFGAMFGMKHFPTPTWPGMFGRILTAPFQCTIYHSYRFVQTQTAQDIMKRKRAWMVAASDPAVSQSEALSLARDNLGSADWAFGDYCFSLLTFAATPQALKEVATAAWTGLADSGMVVAREGAALEAALVSMVPGNARYRPRPGYVTSENFAGMAAFHAFPSGEEKGYWGPPAAIFRTNGGTPYRYHFHVKDVGNTFVCGRTGSGKSTWLAFIVSQAERFGATVVLFDKDRGLKILTHALEGVYLELKNPTGLAPLKALTNDPEDLSYLAILIRGLIQVDGYAMTPEEDRRLHLAIQIVMELPPESRWLWDIRSFLGVEEDGAGARLEKWCHGREFGWVIDNEKDVVRLDAPVLGFDQTVILDNPMARGPVMATLYHYVNKLIDGRRLLFVIDEFWKSLLDEAFRDLVNDKLRTLRKLNSPMILVTQSPRDALVSAIAHTIKDQCPSQVYFSNSRATWEDFGTPGMGLTQAEWEIVKSLPEGRGDFLLKQGAFSVRAQLPLEGMEDEIAILSGRESTTRIFDRVRKEVGDVLEEFHAARKRELT